MTFKREVDERGYYKDLPTALRAEIEYYNNLRAVVNEFCLSSVIKKAIVVSVDNLPQDAIEYGKWKFHYSLDDRLIYIDKLQSYERIVRR